MKIQRERIPHLIIIISTNAFAKTITKLAKIKPEIKELLCYSTWGGVLIILKMVLAFGFCCKKMWNHWYKDIYHRKTFYLYSFSTVNVHRCCWVQQPLGLILNINLIELNWHLKLITRSFSSWFSVGFICYNDTAKARQFRSFQQSFKGENFRPSEINIFHVT